MNVLDVNVLVALHRSDHVHHDVATRWWAGSSESGVPVTVPDPVWSGFVRVVTHRRIFAEASAQADAFGFVRAMLAQPTYLPIGPLPTLLAEFERLCVEGNSRADLVPDAYIAAVARCLGASVVTFDRDFRRFDGLSLVELG